MNQQLLNILLSALSIIVTGLAGLIVTKITQWINVKITDKKAANFLNTITQIVFQCVEEIYQTFVESLKEKGEFDKVAQEKALNECLAKIKTQLSVEIKEYIASNFGDLDSYLKSLIESTIYNLKK